MVRGDPRQDHRLAGEADERTRKARLRGPAVAGKLRLRPPPRTCGPDAGGETSRKGCDRPPFRQAANRGFPAHHHRHRRGMRQAGRGARRGSVRAERRTARFAPLLGFNPRTNPLPAGRLWHMHICSSGGSRCHEYAISGLTFACLNDATDRTQKWRRELAAYILPPCGGDDKRLDLHLSQTMPSGDRITGSESQPVSPHGNGFRERIRCVYALAQSGRGDLQGEGTWATLHRESPSPRLRGEGGRQAG